MPGPTKKPKSLLEIAQEDKDFQGANNAANKPVDYEGLVKEFSEEPEKKKSTPEASKPTSEPLQEDGEDSGDGSQNQPGEIPIFQGFTPEQAEELKKSADPTYSEVKQKSDFANQDKPPVTLTDPNTGQSRTVELKSEEVYLENQKKEEALKKQADEEAAVKEKSIEETGINRPLNFIANVNQAFYGLPATVLESLSMAGNALQRNVTAPLTGQEPHNIEDDPFYQAAQVYRRFIADLSPTNPALQDELNAQVGTALGDLAGLVLTGGVSRGATAANELMQFTKTGNTMAAFKQAGQVLKTPPALVGAMQVGTNEYKTAIAAGATEEEAFGAFLKNGTTGSLLEAIPIMHFFNRLDKSTGGGVKKAIQNGFTQGIDEMTTEVAQQVYANVNAANTYDATRQWYDGMTESGGIGFGLGFVLGAMGTSLRKKQSEAATPEEKADIQKAIDYVDAKATELKLQQENIDKKIQDGGTQTDPGTETGTQQEVPAPGTDQSASEGSVQEVNQGAEVITEEATGTKATENTANPEMDQPALPAQEVVDDASQGEDVAFKNSFLSRVQEFNTDAFTKEGKQKKETKAITLARQSILKDAQKLGYTVKSENGRISIVDSEGKKVSKTPIKQDKSTFRSFEERDPAVKEFYSKLDQDGNLDVAGTVATGKFDIGLSEKDFQKAKADVAAGIKSVPAEKLLNFVENIHKSGQVPFSIGEGANNQKVDIPLDEFLGTKTTREEAIDQLDLDPSNRLEGALVEYISDAGEVNWNRLRNDIEADPDRFTNFVHDLTNEEFATLKDIVYGQREEATFRGEYPENAESASVDEDSQAGEQTQETSTVKQQGRDIRAIKDKARDARDNQDPEKAREVIQEIDNILQRENIVSGDDASFADPTSKTFFDFLDLNKGVYLLSEDANIAQSPEQLQEIIKVTPGGPEIDISNGLSFDDAFEKGIIDQAKKMGYDGMRLLEIDGTNSTLQIWNYDKLEHVDGPDFLAGKKEEPPAPPEDQNPAEETEKPGKLERSFPKQLDKDETLSEEVKEGISEEGRYYYRKSNKETNQQANDIISELGIENAREALMDTKNGIPMPVRVALGENIIAQAKKLIKESTTQAEKSKYINLSIRAADFTAEFLTELGQGVQAASMYAKLSPEGVLTYMQREIKQSRDKKLDEAEPTLNKIKEVIEKLNAETISEILELPKVRDMIIEKSDKVKGSARKKAVKEAIDFLEKFKIDTKGTLQADITFGLGPAVWNGAISTIQTSLQAGLTIAEAVEKAVKYIKDKHKGDWEEKDFRAKFDSDLKKYEASIDPEKAVKRGLKDQEINIKEVIKKHYSEVEKTKRNLADKLISEAGLTEADAKEVSKNIEAAFDKLATKAKEQELNKLRGIKEKTVTKKQTDQLHEKIIKQSNLGALSDEQLRDIYAEKMDLPNLAEEQAQKLMDLSEKVQTSKEGFQQRRAIEELLKYQDSIKGINWMDIGTSIWYANVLSGFSTQEINFFANMAEATKEFWTSALYNPKNIPYLAKGIYEGYGRGFLEAMDTLKTGYSPLKSKKVDSPNILERVKFYGGQWNPFNYYKYVKRIMDAADIFSFHGLREMRAYELAATMARKDGKEASDKGIWKMVSEKLFKTSERLAEAEAMAKSEGLAGNDFKRRVMEIMDQSRPVEMIEDINDFAARGTFNYDPEGTLGFLATQVAAVIEKTSYRNFKPAKFIIPFTRVVANVANRSLDWSIVGFIRAAKGSIGTFVPREGHFHRKYTKEQRIKEMISATSGTMAMIAIYLLSDPGEDDDPVFEITSEGTGDYMDNYELANNGWQKYSIRIGDKWYSYQNTPLAIPFSIIGHMRDDEKYKGNSLENKDALIKFQMAVFNNFQFITDMTFLRGMSDFMGSFSNENPNAAVSYFEKLGKTTIKGFVVPNLFTQTSKELQRLYGIPMKEAKNLQEALIRDMPIARDGLNDMINTLGEPIVADTDRLTSDVESDAVWDLIIKNNAWIGRVRQSSVVIYDPKLKQERLVSDQEYYKFSKIRGQIIKKRIAENIKILNKMRPEQVRKEITEYKKTATEMAKIRIR